MKVIIVDDEKIALEKTENQVKALSFVTDVRSFDNPYHALEALKNYKADAGILDIEMFGMDGLELAQQFKSICPKINIIFLTGYSDYAVKAFKTRADGYLLKPASLEEIQEELLYIQSQEQQETLQQKHIRIQTFGNFEVFVDGKPIAFERNKAKELFAYLVSRKGAYVNGDELLAILYEDNPITVSSKSQLRNLIASLIKSLKAVGAENLVLKRRNQLALNTTVCYCDYLEFLHGNPDSINSYMGEFMSNYEWAEFITGYLESTISNRNM